MMRGLSVAVVLTVALAGCTTTVPTTRVTKDPKVIEAALKTIQQAPPAQQCAGARGPLLLNEVVVINNAELNRELRKIFDEVRAGWTETKVNPPAEIYIVASNKYNGFANVHNQIFINLGVLAAAEYRDEIAFMVAHEMGHVHLGHIAERRQRQISSRQTLSQINDGISMGVVLANTRQVNAGRQASPTFRSELGPGDMNTVAASAAGLRILSSLYAEVGDALYSREQESQADQFALDRLRDTGQSTNGTANFYEQLGRGEEIREKEIAILRGTVSQSVNLATALALRDMKTPDSTVTGLTAAAAGVFGPKLESTIGDLLAPLGVRYDPIEQRRDILLKYEDLWPERTEPDRKRSPFMMAPTANKLAPTAPAPTKTVREYMEAYAVYEAVETALRNREFDVAAKAANNAQLNRLLPVLGSLSRARVAEADAKFDLALRHAEAAKRQPEATPGTFKAVADLLLKLGQHRRALAVLDEAEKRFCTREPFLVARAGAIALSGDTAATLRALAECDATGDATIGRACYLAARPEEKDGVDPSKNPLLKSANTNNNFLDDLLRSTVIPF